MTLFQLPNRTVDAIKNGNPFPGQKTAHKFIADKMWVFPKGIDVLYDIHFWRFFAAHADNLKKNHADLVTDPAKARTALQDATGYMICTVENESSKFVLANTRNFILEVTKELQKALTQKVEDTVLQIALINALRDLFKHFNIDHAIARMYGLEVAAQFMNALVTDARNWRTPDDVFETINGMRDAFDRCMR